MNMGNLYKGLALVGLLGLTACGQGFTGKGGASDVNNAKDVIEGSQTQLEKIQSESDAAEAALSEAQKALDGVLVGGNLALPSVPSGSSLGGILNVADRLRAILDQAYTKLVAAVGKVTAVLPQVRAKLVDAMNRLDPNDPKQAEMIAKIQEMLNKLDQIEARISGIYDLLASKVDILVGRLDQLIDRLNSNGGLGAILVGEVEAVRDVLAEFRDRLANT